MPPVLDMEWNPQSPTCKMRPDPATVRSEMKTFLSMVEKHYGKRPIIYTSVDFFDDNDLSSFRGYPYWLRSVAGHPTEKYAAHPFTFWQYTGTGVDARRSRATPTSTSSTATWPPGRSG